MRALHVPTTSVGTDRRPSDRRGWTTHSRSRQERGEEDDFRHYKTRQLVECTTLVAKVSLMMASTAMLRPVLMIFLKGHSPGRSCMEALYAFAHLAFLWLPGGSVHLGQTGWLPASIFISHVARSLLIAVGSPVESLRHVLRVRLELVLELTIMLQDQLALPVMAALHALRAWSYMHVLHVLEQHTLRCLFLRGACNWGVMLAVSWLLEQRLLSAWHKQRSLTVQRARPSTPVVPIESQQAFCSDLPSPRKATPTHQLPADILFDSASSTGAAVDAGSPPPTASNRTLLGFSRFLECALKQPLPHPVSHSLKLLGSIRQQLGLFSKVSQPARRLAGPAPRASGPTAARAAALVQAVGHAAGALEGDRMQLQSGLPVQILRQVLRDRRPYDRLEHHHHIPVHVKLHGLEPGQLPPHLDKKLQKRLSTYLAGTALLGSSMRHGCVILSLDLERCTTPGHSSPDPSHITEEVSRIMSHLVRDCAVAKLLEDRVSMTIQTPTQHVLFHWDAAQGQYVLTVSKSHTSHVDSDSDTTLSSDSAPLPVPKRPVGGVRLGITPHVHCVPPTLDPWTLDDGEVTVAHSQTEDGDGDGDGESESGVMVMAASSQRPAEITFSMQLQLPGSCQVVGWTPGCTVCATEVPQAQVVVRSLTGGFLPVSVVAVREEAAVDEPEGNAAVEAGGDGRMVTTTVEVSVQVVGHVPVSLSCEVWVHPPVCLPLVEVGTHSSAAAAAAQLAPPASISAVEPHAIHGDPQRKEPASTYAPATVRGTESPVDSARSVASRACICPGTTGCTYGPLPADWRDREELGERIWAQAPLLVLPERWQAAAEELEQLVGQMGSAATHSQPYTPAGGPCHGSPVRTAAVGAVWSASGEDDDDDDDDTQPHDTWAATGDHDTQGGPCSAPSLQHSGRNTPRRGAQDPVRCLLEDLGMWLAHHQPRSAADRVERVVNPLLESLYTQLGDHLLLHMVAQGLCSTTEMLVATLQECPHCLLASRGGPSDSVGSLQPHVLAPWPRAWWLRAACCLASTGAGSGVVYSGTANGAQGQDAGVPRGTGGMTSILHEAMLSGNPDMVQHVLRWGVLYGGPDWSWPWEWEDESGCTALHLAAVQTPAVCDAMLEMVAQELPRAQLQAACAAWHHGTGGVGFTPMELYTRNAGGDALLGVHWRTADTLVAAGAAPQPQPGAATHPAQPSAAAVGSVEATAHWGMQLWCALKQQVKIVWQLDSQPQYRLWLDTQMAHLVCSWAGTMLLMGAVSAWHSVTMGTLRDTVFVVLGHTLCYLPIMAGTGGLPWFGDWQWWCMLSHVGHILAQLAVTLKTPAQIASWEDAITSNSDVVYVMMLITPLDQSPLKYLLFAYLAMVWPAARAYSVIKLPHPWRRSILLRLGSLLVTFLCRMRQARAYQRWQSARKHTADAEDTKVGPRQGPKPSDAGGSSSTRTCACAE